MSQENVELVRRIVEAVNRGDFEGALALANAPGWNRVDVIHGEPLSLYCYR